MPALPVSSAAAVYRIVEVPSAGCLQWHLHAEYTLLAPDPFRRAASTAVWV